MEKHKPFSYAYYRTMLTEAKDSGYVVSSFADFNACNSKTIILRHDIDYTLNGVLEIARIEQELGMTATYLFRVHANEYNLFAPYVYALVRKVASMGHEIGVHFEAHSVGRAISHDFEGLLRKEISIFETIFDVKVKTFTEHRDFTHTIDGLGFFHETHDMDKFGVSFYAMAPEWAKNMKYISDSNASWREGDILMHLNQWNRLQVLVHPDWWSEDHLLLKGPYFHGAGNG
ncbi:hypothetical protein ACQKIK_01155 [Pseudomonas sp. NPDC047961]